MYFKIEFALLCSSQSLFSGRLGFLERFTHLKKFLCDVTLLYKSLDFNSIDPKKRNIVINIFIESFKLKNILDKDSLFNLLFNYHKINRHEAKLKESLRDLRYLTDPIYINMNVKLDKY